MSELNTNATVTLTVNGRQAQEMLDNLKQKATQLETAIDKARRSGDKASLKRLQKELNQTNAQIKQIQSATASAEDVMRRLDRATPKQLNQTLSLLRRQLNGIERGSEAWTAQVAKIKAVKAELDRVNAEFRQSETLLQRVNRNINEWGTTIAGAAAAATGLIMAGRSAVNTYAEWEQEMANVSKFTSLSMEQVRELNAEMAKMNTRTSIIELNRYAEDAGKLGMKSIEDIMGYVRGADQINVALSDIGDGATLVLSKLSDIFGIKRELGTEQALLSIGSTITELSQNCTASSAYLANFAKRMGGVGKAAGMTLPQLIAIGAVLDANGQAAEMSATAVSKLIMDAYKESDKFAKALNLNAEQFKKVMAEDANAGFLMIIERFKEIGNMDALAPVFKDMGENGARASQVMATLANNLDMVKWEQEEAQKAFDSATKVTQMYDIQNNTAQAGIEKARKRVAALAAELGEKLLPVMRHVYTTSSLTLRFLSTTVSFVLEHRRVLISLTAAIAAYTVAVNLAVIKQKLLNSWVVVSTTATKAYEVVVNHLKAAQLALQLGVAKLTGNYARQNVIMTELKTKTAALTNVYALMAAAVVAAVVAIVSSLNRQSRAQQMLGEIEAKARRNTAEDIKRIEILKTTIENETLSIDNRRKAIEELQSIIPDYHASLSDEGELIGHNAEVLGLYVEQLKNTAKIQAALAKLPEAEERLRSIQREAPENLTNAMVYEKTEGLSPEEAAGRAGASPAAYRVFRSQLEEANAEVKQLNRIIDGLTAQNQSLADQAKGLQVSKGNGGDSEDEGGGDSSGNEDGKGTKLRDRFQQEKEWRERQQAEIRISYARGEADYEQYKKRLEEIEVEYGEKLLARTDLTEQERITAEADYYEALVAQAKAGLQRTKEAEDAAFEEQKMALQQRYIDGESTTETYQEALRMLELEHARKMVDIYKEGTKERLAAERAYQDKLLADAQKRRQKVENEEKKHQQKLEAIKKEYFGLNAMERQQALSQDLEALRKVYMDEVRIAGNNAKEKLRIEEAYQKGRVALIRKYGGEELNGMQQATQAVVEWLDSDGGEAILESFDVVVSGMGAIFSGLSDIVQAELEIQTAAINRRYDAETSFAEGNTYKVKKLERDKEQEIARIKNEANRKMFAMQVIQAVAQTAQNALAAYGSAAQVPIVGYILAPIAAATAVAAGAIQIAAIKKQQQASEAQGYAEGGFTPKGPKDLEVGVVHAGEWVASQALVNSPVARPMIEALDYAQRTNTIGTLRSEDVSRTITAPAVIARQSEDGRLLQTMAATAAALSSYSSVIDRLNRRLNEPFVTVNTVEGDRGIKRAQEEYDNLMRNKTPRSQR